MRNSKLVSPCVRFAGIVFAVTLIAAASPATAGFTDNFDSENGGVPQAAYSGLANFHLAQPNTIDLLGPVSDRLGTTNLCYGGGSSLCIRLAGNQSIGPNGLFSFNAGDTIGFSVQARGGRDEPSFLEFRFQSPNGPIHYDAIESNFGAYTPVPNAYGSGISGYALFLPFSEFSERHTYFTAREAGSVYLRLTSSGYGTILDNFSLISPGGVPEPSAWTLLIVGFGLVGGAMRRGRKPHREWAVS